MIHLVYLNNAIGKWSECFMIIYVTITLYIGEGGTCFRYFLQKKLFYGVNFGMYVVVGNIVVHAICDLKNVST